MKNNSVDNTILTMNAAPSRLQSPYYGSVIKNGMGKVAIPPVKKSNYTVPVVTTSAADLKRYSSLCPGEPGCPGEADAGVSYGGNSSGGKNPWYQSVPWGNILNQILGVQPQNNSPIPPPPPTDYTAVIVGVSVLLVLTAVGVAVYTHHK